MIDTMCAEDLFVTLTKANGRSEVIKRATPFSLKEHNDLLTITQGDYTIEIASQQPGRHGQYTLRAYKL